MNLSEVAINGDAVITKITGRGTFRKRIMEMESKYKSTVTFWIKTYGFSDDKGISIFNIGKYLEITFSGSLNNEKNIIKK